MTSVPKHLLCTLYILHSVPTSFGIGVVELDQQLQRQVVLPELVQKVQYILCWVFLTMELVLDTTLQTADTGLMNMVIGGTVGDLSVFSSRLL